MLKNKGEEEREEELWGGELDYWRYGVRFFLRARVVNMEIWHLFLSDE